VSEAEGKIDRMRALQARRSALIYFSNLTAPSAERDEVGRAIRRISSELQEMTKLKVVGSS
jgi:hypothetical protein